MDPYNKDRLVFLNNIAALESKVFILPRLITKLEIKIRTTAAYIHEGRRRMYIATEVLGHDSRGFFIFMEPNRKQTSK